MAVAIDPVNITELKNFAGFDEESDIYSKLDFINTILLKDSPQTGINFNKILDEDPIFKITHEGVTHKVSYVIGGSHGINAIYNNSNLLKVNDVHTSYINKNSKINSNNRFFTEWKKLDMDTLVKSFDCDLHLFINTHTADGKGVDLLTDICKSEGVYYNTVSEILTRFFEIVKENINRTFEFLFYNNEAESKKGYFFDIDAELKKFGYKIQRESNGSIITCGRIQSLGRAHLDGLPHRAGSNIFGRIWYTLAKLNPDGSVVIKPNGYPDTTRVILYDVAWERAFKVLPIENFQGNNVMKYHDSYQVKYYFNNDDVSIVMFSLYDIIKNYISLIEQPDYRKRHKAILRLYFIMSILKNRELINEDIKREILDNPSYKNDIIIILEKFKTLLDPNNLVENSVFNVKSFTRSYQYIYNSDPDPAKFTLVPFILEPERDIRDIIEKFNILFFQIDKVGDEYVINYGENKSENKGYSNYIPIVDEIIAGFRDNSLLQPSPIETLTIESCIAKFREYIDDKIQIVNMPKPQTIVPGLIERYNVDRNEIDNKTNIYSRLTIDEISHLNTAGSNHHKYITTINNILSRINEYKYVSSAEDNNKYFIVYCPISYSYDSKYTHGNLKKSNKLNPTIYFHRGFIYGTTDYNKFIKNIHRDHDIAVLLVRYDDIYYVNNNQEIILPLGTNFLILDENYLKYSMNETHTVYGIVRQNIPLTTLDEFIEYYQLGVFNYFLTEKFIAPDNFNANIKAVDNYILSNISPYNNIFRLDYTVKNPEIFGIEVQNNTKLFSENNIVFRSFDFTIPLPNIIEYEPNKENLFFITINALFLMKDDSINAHLDYIRANMKVGIEEFKSLNSIVERGFIRYVSSDDTKLILRQINQNIYDRIIMVIQYLQEKYKIQIDGLHVPNHIWLVNNVTTVYLDDRIYSFSSDNFRPTNNIFFKADKTSNTPDINKKDELIKSEITKLISINNPKLTNKGGMKYKNPLSLDVDTQSLSSVLKDFNQERNFRELFNYIETNKNPVLAGGSNLKFYKKYLKYKNKYMILKNKQI